MLVDPCGFTSFFPRILLHENDDEDENDDEGEGDDAEEDEEKKDENADDENASNQLTMAGCWLTPLRSARLQVILLLHEDVINED